MRRLSLTLVVVAAVAGVAPARAERPPRFFHAGLGAVDFGNFPSEEFSDWLILGIVPLSAEFALGGSAIRTAAASFEVLPVDRSCYGGYLELGQSRVLSHSADTTYVSVLTVEHGIRTTVSGDAGRYRLVALDYGVRGRWLSFDEHWLREPGTVDDWDATYGSTGYLAGYLGLRWTHVLNFLDTFKAFELRVRVLGGVMQTGYTRDDAALWEYERDGTTPVVVGEVDRSGAFWGAEASLRWFVLHTRVGYVNDELSWTAGLVIGFGHFFAD